MREVKWQAPAFLNAAYVGVFCLTQLFRLATGDLKFISTCIIYIQLKIKASY